MKKYTWVLVLVAVLVVLAPGKSHAGIIITDNGIWTNVTNTSATFDISGTSTEPFTDHNYIVKAGGSSASAGGKWSITWQDLTYVTTGHGLNMSGVTGSHLVDSSGSPQPGEPALEAGGFGHTLNSEGADSRQSGSAAHLDGYDALLAAIYVEDISGTMSWSVKIMMFHGTQAQVDQFYKINTPVPELPSVAAIFLVPALGLGLFALRRQKAHAFSPV